MLTDSRKQKFNPHEGIEEIHDRIVGTLKKFFKEAGQTKAVLGLSGGIDCAVTAALAVEALGAENVTGILMPSEFSSIHSVCDAVDLANNLNIQHYTIPIEKIYNRMIREVEVFFEDKKAWDNTQENIQARIRGTILMAYSNRNGAMLLNTTNKSELSAGYGTLYGDLAGALMVIADIYKMQVYEMAAFINRERTIIPVSTITKAPSAELREGQKDSDSLPDYAVLDQTLYMLNECGMTEEQILQEGVEKALLDKVLKLRRGSAFKAHQLPPVIKVTQKPLLDRSKWVEL